MKKRLVVSIIVLAFSLMSCGTASTNLNSPKSDGKRIPEPFETEMNSSMDLSSAVTDETDTSSLWKVYQYTEYNFEFSCPQQYTAEESEGHRSSANPELGTRVSLCSSQSGDPSLDIDQITKQGAFRSKYTSAEDYIKFKGLPLLFDEDDKISDKHHVIYGLKEGGYYYSFYENDTTIFELSSPSKDFLKKIMATFTLE